VFKLWITPLHMKSYQMDQVLLTYFPKKFLSRLYSVHIRNLELTLKQYNKLYPHIYTGLFVAKYARTIFCNFLCCKVDKKSQILSEQCFIEFFNCTILLAVKILIAPHSKTMGWSSCNT
jgi:hypothetical protein